MGEGLRVITPERTHADQPTRRIGFETMVKKIVVSGELRTFIVRRAYGNAGNPFRHGDNDDGDREHALVLVIVLAGLLDLISEYRVSDLLGDLASHYLLQAIEQRSDMLGAG